MSRFVLIADGNAGRRRRLAEACEALGIQAKTAPHGAAALELALTEHPHLVVAPLDLPLVDARRLAEILRANPHTRNARFIFLEEDDRMGERRVGDWTLSAKSGANELVARVQEALERQDRIQRLEERTGSGGGVEGELMQLPLADLLQLFHANRRSGRLVVDREPEAGEDASGAILVQNGDIIRAEVGSVEGEKALFRLLTWPQGHFRFEPGERNEAPGIFAPTRALLGEGLRQIEEWDRLAPRLPPMDSPLKLKVKTSELPNIVHPLTQEVLLLLETYAQVRQVVERCSFPDYQVLRTLHTLSERGIVRIGRAPVVGPSRDAKGLFDEAQGRRLRDWLRGESPREGPIPDAKLVLAAAEPEGLVDFINLLRATPQVTVSEACGADGSVPEDGFGPIARIAIDEGVGIRIYHLPRLDRFAPLWPRVTYDALSVLFLLSGPLHESAERVRPMAEVVRDLPRSRAFHVAMLRKDERMAPDELREHTSLIEETSLFLLPLEGDKDPATVLRGLFARVVP